MSGIERSGVHIVSEKASARGHSGVPFVSIILPIRNEQRMIARVLDRLLSQDYPGDRLEILVADGMSTDNTRSVVSTIAAGDARIRLLDNPQGIMASGFNLGLKEAMGDIIIMMGGHTEIAPNYVRASASLLQDGLADCVGGSINSVGQTDVAQAIALAMSARFGVGGSAFRIGCNERRYVDTVAFGAYTRTILERAGPLDEEFVRNQDDELNYRIRKLGGRILIDPELHSWYHSRSSIRSLCRQYFQYGYWKVRVLQEHPRQMQVRQFVPAVFILFLLTSFVFALSHPSIGIRMMLLVGGSYLLATLLVAVQLAGRTERWRLAPVLAMSFPALHFSYGAGFLIGLARFSHRWRRRKGTAG